MMLDLLNKIASMEFPRIQKQNEKLVREYMAESRATPMDQQDLAEEIGIDDGYLVTMSPPALPKTELSVRVPPFRRGNPPTPRERPGIFFRPFLTLLRAGRPLGASRVLWVN